MRHCFLYILGTSLLRDDRANGAINDGLSIPHSFYVIPDDFWSGVSSLRHVRSYLRL